MIRYRDKGFSIVEFLVASSLTLAVVGSSTIAIATSEKIQRSTFFKDKAVMLASTIINGSKVMNCGSLTNLSNAVTTRDSYIEKNCSSSLELNDPIKGLQIPTYDGDYTYSINPNNPSSTSGKFNITYRTAWLTSGSLDVTSSIASANSSYTTPMIELFNSQPYILRRTVLVTWKSPGNNDMVYGPITDIESFDGISNSLVASDSASKGTTSAYYCETPAPLSPKNIILSRTGSAIKTTRVIGATATQVNQKLPSESCAWFPFLERTGTYSITVDGVNKAIVPGAKPFKPFGVS
jgi:hypothetical protein